MALTAKQQRFVAEYLIDLNATQAAIRAGYKGENADVTGPRLLGNVGVSAAIAEGQKALAESAGVTAERIVKELAKLGFSNMQDYVGVNGEGSPFIDLSAVDREKWAAVGELTIEHFTKRGETEGEDSRVVEKVKFKLLDKRAALVDLGKHLGMFIERRETTVTNHMVMAPPPEKDADDWAGKHGPH
jgi:phage terminase small subunit